MSLTQVKCLSQLPFESLMLTDQCLDQNRLQTINVYRHTSTGLRLESFGLIVILLNLPDI